MFEKERQLSLCVFGAAPDTGNLGVSALCYSILGGAVQRSITPELTVFDFGRGLRRQTADFECAALCFDRCGAMHTRRHYRRESLWNIYWCSRLGGLGNPAANRLLGCDAVLDISGGDSFTDLYGGKRFEAVLLPKRIALKLRKPLVLLPQTYGPFGDPGRFRVAAKTVGLAQQAWARDPRSFEVLKDLAGGSFDPQRHRCGVDMAFALETRRPRAALPIGIEEWLVEGNDVPVVGLNVSGLILNSPEEARRRYLLRADYLQAIQLLLRRFLSATNARIVLVPHVNVARRSVESDMRACEVVAESLGREADGRVAVLTPLSDPREIKWVIARCEWFCGTRMHSTIAALSSGVPTAAIAYSDKTRGVFETCGLGADVADPRAMDEHEISEQLWRCWTMRTEAKHILAARLPTVATAAREQMDEILRGCCDRLVSAPR